MILCMNNLAYTYFCVDMSGNCLLWNVTGRLIPSSQRERTCFIQYYTVLQGMVCMILPLSMNLNGYAYWPLFVCNFV